MTLSPKPAAGPTAKANVVHIAQVTHDLVRRRSLVLLIWPNDPERRLSLPIPFDTKLGDITREAQIAMNALASEIGSIHVTTPGG